MADLRDFLDYELGRFSDEAHGPGNDVLEIDGEMTDDGEREEEEPVSSDKELMELMELMEMLSKHTLESDDDDDLENIGDANDYHNRSCNIARHHEFDRAAKVCEAGLKKYPLNVDLVADIVNYLAKCGDFEGMHHYLQIQLDHIPRSTWNWRSFTFAIDALVAEGASRNEELLRKLTADYQAMLPHEERAYMAAHDVAKALGNEAEAIEALEKAVCVHPAAQSCCLRLADYLIERGDFERARTIALLGIASSAQSQPSIRTPYCALLVCLCDDALMWLDLADGKVLDAASVTQVIRAYDALEKFKIKLLPYQDQIEERKGLLNFLLTSLTVEA